jgi:hypothetical protein
VATMATRQRLSAEAGWRWQWHVGSLSRIVGAPAPNPTACFQYGSLPGIKQWLSARWQWLALAHGGMVPALAQTYVVSLTLSAGACYVTEAIAGVGHGWQRWQ